LSYPRSPQLVVDGAALDVVTLVEELVLIDEEEEIVFVDELEDDELVLVLLTLEPVGETDAEEEEEDFVEEAVAEEEEDDDEAPGQGGPAARGTEFGPEVISIIFDEVASRIAGAIKTCLLSRS
jgi:hypothetical protein